jgi:hypothetical protein
MYRITLAIILTIAFAGCDALSTMTEGFKYAKAVEGDLEQETGVKPQVGFNSTNGRLVSVTVASRASTRGSLCRSWPGWCAPR